MFKLHENWKSAWKWFQVQIGVLIAAAPQAFEQVTMLKGYISDAAMHNVMSALGVLLVLNAIRKKASADTQ